MVNIYLEGITTTNPTPEYLLKKKLLFYKYPDIDFREV